MNKDVIMKNLSGILCGLCILALVFPFCTVTASVDVMGASSDSETAVKGIKMITDGGMWGILFIVSLVAIFAFNYLKQLMAYKKIASLAGSVLLVLSLFMAPGKLSAVGGEEGTLETEVTVAYGIGFWIMLVCGIALAALAIIGFFNLKGNAVFDAINAQNDDTNAQGVTMPNFGGAAQKLGNMTKNAAGAISRQAGNLADKTRHADQNTATPAQPTAAPVQSAPTAMEQPAVAQTPVKMTTAPTQTVPAPIVKEDSDFIMEQIGKLFEMKEKGILTEEEFTQKKTELLKKM